MKLFASCLLLVLSIASVAQPDYTLVWYDEFDAEGAVDQTKWFHQTFAPALVNGEASWFNGEEQHYTDRLENSFVESGFLKIVAKKETFNNGQSTKSYTSARLNSKYAFTYGKVEVRAKLPEGRGTWPAIWTLGQNINETGGYWQTQGFATTDWPATGEIDIMEHWGDTPNEIHWSNHTPFGFGGNPNTQKGIISNVSSEFHVYAIEWDENEIRYLVDDVLKHTYNPSPKSEFNWPFDKPQYILLNVAMGGIFQSDPRVIDPNFTESTMEIDYVRIYEETVALEADARLSDLRVDGETVSGFNLNQTDYSVLVPSSVSGIPTVSFDKNSTTSSVVIDEATGIPGTTTITVTSQDQSDVKVYSVEFRRSVSVPLAFESDGVTYDFNNFGGGFATIIDNPDPDLLNTTSKVLQTTKSPGEVFGGIALPLDFPVDFTNGSIIKVKVNAPRAGVPLTFKLESPTGPNEIIRSNTKSGEWEVMSFNFSGLEKDDYDAITLIWDNGTMGDGSANWLFLVDEIEVVNQISNVSTLDDLKVNGATLSDFSPSKLEYVVPLATLDAAIPSVEVSTSNAEAVFQITEATTLPGTTSILVVAEDGLATSEYTVSFTSSEPLGLSEKDILVYPNPVTDKLILSFPNISRSLDEGLRILDLRGSVLPVQFERKAEEVVADVSALPSGIYFVKLDNVEELSFKFFKR